MAYYLLSPLGDGTRLRGVAIWYNYLYMIAAKSTDWTKEEQLSRLTSMGDFATFPELLPYLDRSWLNENIDTGSKKKEVYLLAFSFTPKSRMRSDL